MGVLALNKNPLPPFATLPKNSIYPDFWKTESGFPQNIVTPVNKHHIYEHDTPVTMQPRIVATKKKTPFPFFGYKFDNKCNAIEGKVDINSLPVDPNFEYWNKEVVGGLIGDHYWCDTSGPLTGNNYSLWHSDELITIGANQVYMFLDFEHHNVWTPDHVTKMNQIIGELRAACPWVKVGLWARHDATMGPFYDPNNPGVLNDAGYNYYAQMYFSGPGNAVSGYYNSTNLNMSSPFAYMKGRQDSQLGYNLMHSVEISQRYNPNVICVPTAWSSIETVSDYDGDKADTDLEHNRTDRVIRASEKLQTPPSVIFAFSILGLTVWNGVYWFGTGSSYSDNINSADETGVQPDGNGNSIYTEVVRGKTFRVFYRWQYQGFINYGTVANYMCSLEPYKSIIEASTPWILAEFKKNTDAVWYTGLKTTPSWCYGNKAPIIRLKYSSDGTKCMYIAVNFTAGLIVESWDFRVQNGGWEAQVKLRGAWLEMGYIDTTIL